jgi:hypothetical protein
MWTDEHVKLMPVRQMLTRRSFMEQISTGLGSIAFFSLLTDAMGATNAPQFDVLPKKPHSSAKAKRVILLFQNGGPSHMDLFDPKPELRKQHGEKPGADFMKTIEVKRIGQGWMGSPFQFSKFGRSGMEFSELLPGLAEHADEIAVIRSMVTVHNNHEQAIWNFNTGLIQPGRPSLGSWVVYGLGTQNQNLPAYVSILNPQGLPVDGVRNFSSGWMPPVYQGMAMRAEGTPVINLEPSGTVEAIKGRLDLLRQLNLKHLESHSDQLELEARIASFELAAKMQVEASGVLDLSKEPKETHDLYGTGNPETATYGRQCLLARRLVENGVRFVQLLHRGQPWDTHVRNDKETQNVCRKTDRPTAALLTDLKRRGMLEDTLVIWAGEFGRTPMSDARQGADGRDHHKYGFSLWMAGGGVKGGVTHGRTDDFGYHAVENIVTVPDFHATVLHLLGLDYERLTYRHGTRDERLTDVHPATVVKAIMA